MKRRIRVISLILLLSLLSLIAQGCGSSATVSSSDTVGASQNVSGTENSVSDAQNSSTSIEVAPGSPNNVVTENRNQDASPTANSSGADLESSIAESSSSFQTESSYLNTVTDNRTQAPSLTAEFSGDDFESHGYLYENSIGASLYYVIVKNNSEAVVSVDGNATAKDSNGIAIGADTMSSIDVLGPGESSIGYFYFENTVGIDTVEYDLTFSRELYYKPIIGNLEVNQVLNEQNVTVSVTNIGDINAQFVEANALFFDANNQVIFHSSVYITDNDHEIKPGATLSGQLDIYGQVYDHVEVYFTGRSDGTSSEVVSIVSDSDFSISEHWYENSIGNTVWFLVVTNNSPYDVELSANSSAYDSAGNIIGADDTSIDILGAGQTSICNFYYDSVTNIDHIEYQLFYNTESYYEDVLHNLSANTTINDSNVVVSVTNNGSYPAEFVEAYALFYDENMNLVGYDSTYLTDNDYEIKSGATIAGQLSIYQGFSSVEVYLTGRHSTW